MNDIASQIADNVGAAVEACNSLPIGSRALTFHYNRRNPKRRRLMEPMAVDSSPAIISDIPSGPVGEKVFLAQSTMAGDGRRVEVDEQKNVYGDSDEGPVSLTKMVAVLCEQRLFLPLLRAFEMFLPSCSLLSFIRALQVCDQVKILLYLRWFNFLDRLGRIPVFV